MQSYFIIYTLWIAYDHNSMLIQVNFGLTSALKLSKYVKIGPKPQTGATAGTGRTTGRYTGRPALTYSYDFDIKLFKCSKSYLILTCIHDIMI